jgi:TolA-binding protein
VRNIRCLCLVLATVLSNFGCGHDESPVASNAPLTADERLFQDALALYDAGRYSEAQAKFDELVRMYPDSRRHDNAELASYADAIVTLNGMISAHASSPYVHSAEYFVGRSEFQLTQYQEAVANFSAALGTDPAGLYADNAQYYLGRSYYEIGEYGLAEPELARLESSYPGSSYIDNARYYYGRCAYDQSSYAAAVPRFTNVLSIMGSSYADDALYYRGRSEYALDDDAAALATFQRLVSEQPGSQYADNAQYYELRIYVDRGDCASAQPILDALRATTGQYATLAASYFASNGC